MNKLSKTTKKLRYNISVAEKTIDPKLEEARQNLNRLNKLLVDLLQEMQKQKDLKLCLSHPISLFADHMSNAYLHIAEVISLSIDSYLSNYNEFANLLEQNLAKCDVFKKQMSARDECLMEFDSAKEILRSTIDKVLLSSKGPEKHQQIESKVLSLKDQYENLNEHLITGLTEFYKANYSSIKEDFKKVVLSQMIMISTIHESYKQLGRFVEYSSPDSQPIVKINQEEDKRLLGDFIVDENWVKSEATIPKILCQICRRYVRLDQADQHSKTCSSTQQSNFRKTFTVQHLENLMVEYASTISDLFSRESKNPVVRTLIRRDGIPSDLRGKLWPIIAAVSEKKSTSIVCYGDLVRTFSGRESISTDQIEKDLTRTFSTNSVVQSDENLQKMRNILIVYSFINPSIGYCQSMNFLVAVLLLYLNEEDAFWTLCVLIEDILPKDFYSKYMTGLLVEKRVLKYLLDLKFPKLSSHLGKLQLDVELITIRWLLCCFASVLPLNGSARVLDLVLYEGPKMLHKIALAIFKMNEKAIMKLDDFNEAFVFLQEMTQTIDCDQMIKLAIEIQFPKRKLKTLREMYLPKALRDRYNFESEEAQPSRRKAVLFRMSNQVDLKKEDVRMDPSNVMSDSEEPELEMALEDQGEEEEPVDEEIPLEIEEVAVIQRFYKKKEGGDK